MKKKKKKKESLATWLNLAHSPRPSTKDTLVSIRHPGMYQLSTYSLSFLLEEKAECVLSLLGIHNWPCFTSLIVLADFCLVVLFIVVYYPSLILVCKFLWGLCYTWQTMEIDMVIQTEGFGEQRGPSWHLEIQHLRIRWRMGVKNS